MGKHIGGSNSARDSLNSSPEDSDSGGEELDDSIIHHSDDDSTMVMGGGPMRKKKTRTVFTRHQVSKIFSPQKSIMINLGNTIRTNV